MRLPRRRHKPAVEAAKLEEQWSQQRLDEAKAIAADVKRIAKENHFADAIAYQIMRGAKG